MSTFFLIFAALPILILLGSVSGATWRWTTEGRTTVAGADGSLLFVGAGGLLFIGPLLLILFCQKYRRWWFD